MLPLWSNKAWSKGVLEQEGEFFSGNSFGDATIWLMVTGFITLYPDKF